MRIKETKVYPFSELSDEAKEMAIQELADINTDYEWWDLEYEDAAQVGLKLTGFDIGRGNYCKGQFIEYAENTAKNIVDQHGACCPTHETAMAYIESSEKLTLEYPVYLDSEDYDDNEIERENRQEILDNDFLRSILEDYRIILRKQFEYLQSEESIIETIEANEYEFTEDGQLA